MNLDAKGSGTDHIAVPTTDVNTQHTGDASITLYNVLFIPDLISNKAQVTRLLSQRAAHTLTDGTKPPLFPQQNLP